MRWSAAWGLVLLLLVAPFGVQADAGRAAPECIEQPASSLPPTLAVDPGVCVTVDLGVLSPGDVYDFSIIVVDDAIDVLFFDQNSIQPYELGQSYRSVMAQPASTESALGALEFHWKVPPSIAGKRWYMVLDNSAHDGDAGQGDQGGLRSTVSATVERLDQAYWTPYHDLVSVEAGAHEVLLSGDDLRLDAGTTMVLSAWDLTFVGDVYLQTRTMHDRYLSGGVGVQFIDGGALQSVDTPKSLTWQVPSGLEGEELLLVVDNTDAPLGGGNGTEALRMTVRLELAPPLTPTVVDHQNGTVALGELATLNASTTPNRLGQQGTFVWDMDASVDANGDGNPTNDADASGVVVEGSWSLPGLKTITVTMTAPSGQTATTTHAMTVVDVVPPVARLQTDGVPVAGGWRVNVNNAIVLNCASSTDDHAVAGCDWTVDGETTNNTSTRTLTPDTIRSYNVTLTVTDLSGNTANVSAVIASVDPTVPTFDTGLLAAFPTRASQGETVSFEVAVDDAFDAATQLTVHWDLQPSKDTNNNGDPRDDPDRVGLNPALTFDEPGLNEIVVTVFDASNNSATYAFSVNVEATPSSIADYTFQALWLVVLTIIAVSSVVGFRTVQRHRGFNLLLSNGLSPEEARARMAKVAQQGSLGLFASPEDHAGVSSGERVVSAEEQRAAEAEAEMEAIYGNAPSADPNAGFAPSSYNPPQLSQASSQAAAEAAALFGGEPVSDAGADPLSNLVEEIAGASAVAVPVQSATVETAPSVQSAVSEPSVALPESMPGLAEDSEPPAPPPSVSSTPPAPPAPTVLQHTCTSCTAVFEIDMPAGLSSAIVACPGCGVDQTVVSGL